MSDKKFELQIADNAYQKIESIKSRVNTTTIASTMVFLILLGDTVTQEIMNGSNIIIEKPNGKTYKLTYERLND